MQIFFLEKIIKIEIKKWMIREKCYFEWYEIECKNKLKQNV
jgi:hypothetical protein